MHDPLYDRLEADKVLNTQPSPEQVVDDIRSEIQRQARMYATGIGNEGPMQEAPKLPFRPWEAPAPVKRTPVNREERRAAARWAKKQGKKA
jgi:hypothetical protein